MSGYDWNAGMSNCAVAAYEDGLLPASKLAAALKERGYKVSTTFIRENFTPDSWHHTSAKFNETDFYDLREVVEEIEDDPDLQAKIAEEAARQAAARKSRETFVADVTVTDWVENRCNYRTFRYPQKRTLRGVQVTQVPGAVMIQIEGEGRRKAANCVIQRLDNAEVRRRRNAKIAAKRKATIAARKAARAEALETIRINPGFSVVGQSENRNQKRRTT
jgi:hypothetical protein